MSARDDEEVRRWVDRNVGHTAANEGATFRKAASGHGVRFLKQAPVVPIWGFVLVCLLISWLVG